MSATSVQSLLWPHQSVGVSFLIHLALLISPQGQLWSYLSVSSLLGWVAAISGAGTSMHLASQQHWAQNFVQNRCSTSICLEKRKTSIAWLSAARQQQGQLHSYILWGQPKPVPLPANIPLLSSPHLLSRVPVFGRFWFNEFHSPQCQST